MFEPFPSDRFQITAYCDACVHSAGLPALCLSVPADELRRRLRCSACDQKQVQIRIQYTGAGGFLYGRQ